MNTYRVRFFDEARVNCITRFKAKYFGDAIKIAKENYGAITILECDLV